MKNSSLEKFKSLTISEEMMQYIYGGSGVTVYIVDGSVTEYIHKKGYSLVESSPYH